MQEYNIELQDKVASLKKELEKLENKINDNKLSQLLTFCNEKEKYLNQVKEKTEEMAHM